MPKIHKVGKKMRPVVSNIDAPTYKLSKWIVQHFKTLQQPEGLYVKNSFDFVERTKDVKLEPDEIMVSFDVDSLYPNTPIDEAVKEIAKWLEECTDNVDERTVLMEATKICMDKNQFVYDNRFFKLSKGTNMGNPLSCFVANIFMCGFEMDLKNKNLLPRIWWRYVDDVFAIIKKKDLETVLSTLNNTKFKTIHFTHQIEENNQLAFLDLNVNRKPDGTITFGIYRKPTSTTRFITSDSYCPPSHKMAAFHSMTYRLCKLPLPVREFMDELKYIKLAANVNGFHERIVNQLVEKHSKKIKKQNMSTFFNETQNNRRRVCFNYAAPLTNRLKEIYRKHNVDLVFASENKLKSLLISTKNKIEVMKRSGIYEIECKVCKKIYIGQTRRQVIQRYKEHCAHIRYNRPEKSAVAKHVLKDLHSGLNQLDVKLKKRVTKPHKLDAWESFYMHKYKTELMNTDPAPILSPLFNY